MHPALDEPAFTYEAQPVAIGEVVLAAVYWGEWGRLEQDVELGLREVARQGEGEPDELLRALLIEWRRERRLLSAEDYRAWIAARGVSLEDMSAYLRRALARRRAGESAPASAYKPVDPEALTAATYPEAILGGRLRSWAELLAQRAGAARALRARAAETPPPSAGEVDELVAHAQAAGSSRLDDVPPPRLEVWGADVLALERAWERFRADAAPDELIERCIRSHHVDWQRLAWEEATFAREDVANEAAIWVREEHVPLTEIAQRAGSRASAGEAYADGGSELGRLLVGARPGELLGPFASEDGWRLVHLRERVPPSPGDPRLRTRAADELLEDALAPYLAGRVEWHERL